MSMTAHSGPGVHAMATMSTSERLIEDRARELRGDANFVNALFESLVGCAIIAADFDGNIIALNEGAHQAYGYASGEIIGKPVRDVTGILAGIPGDVKRDEMELVGALFEEG